MRSGRRSSVLCLLPLPLAARIIIRPPFLQCTMSLCHGRVMDKRKRHVPRRVNWSVRGRAPRVPTELGCCPENRLAHKTGDPMADKHFRREGGGAPASYCSATLVWSQTAMGGAPREENTNSRAPTTSCATLSADGGSKKEGLARPRIHILPFLSL